MSNHVGKDWVVILGHSFEKRSVRRFLILCVLGVCSAVSLSYIFIVHGTADKVEPLEVGETPNLQDESVEFKDPLKALIARHIAATGYDELRWFLIRGNFKQEGLFNVPLTLMGRHPGIYKQVLEFGGRKIESGYVDAAIWGNAPNIFPTEDESRIARENRAFLLLQLSIPALAWLDLSLPLQANYELLPDAYWNGRQVSVIENRSFEAPIRHYVDVETAVEVRRTASVMTQDGSEHLVELIFDAPATGLSFPFPSGYVCQLDGKEVNSVKFTNGGFNSEVQESG